MLVVRFHCLFVGFSGYQDGGGNRLTKTSLITHLRDRHCSDEATHTLQSKCCHGNNSDIVSPPDRGDSVVQFVLYDITKPKVPSCLEQSVYVDDGCWLGFSRVLKRALDKSAIKRQCQEESIVNTIRLWGMSGGSLQLLRETLAESSPTFSNVDDEDLDLGEQNIKQYKRKICNGHYTTAVRVLSSSGVAPFSDATLEDLKTKHPFQHDGLRVQHLMDCLSGAVVAIFDELVSFITQVVNLFLVGNYAQMLGEYISSAPLTPLVKPSGVIRLIAMGGSEAILHVVNRLIEGCGDVVGGFKKAFNFVDREFML
ncbi:hypothetical protein Tco_1028021 [Tanacetum coccineum]